MNDSKEPLDDPSNKVLAVPYLVSPPNNAMKIPLTGVNLSWTNVFGASKYDVRCRAGNYGGPIQGMDLWMTNFYINFPPLDQGQRYYWSARAKNAEETGAWSNEFTFVTLIEPPKLGNPANASVILGPTVSVSWAPIPNVVSYELQCATDSVFTAMVADIKINSTSWLIQNLVSKKRYFWRVRSIGQEDSSQWSPAQYFEIK